MKINDSSEAARRAAEAAARQAAARRQAEEAAKRNLVARPPEQVTVDTYNASQVAGAGAFAEQLGADSASAEAASGAPRTLLQRDSPPPGCDISEAEWRELPAATREEIWRASEEQAGGVTDPDWPGGPLTPGTNTPENARMQERLVELGYMADPGNAAGRYGPATTEAVRQFQLANGITPADGVASEETLAAMGAAGARSTEDVARMQERLAELGMLPAGAATGTFGPATERAMAELQLANGLPVTGTADAETLAVLASPTARSPREAVEDLEGEHTVGRPIGVAGEAPVPSAAEINQAPVTARVTSGQIINCREGTSTNHTVVGRFAPGTELTVTGPAQDGWYPVTGMGVDGAQVTGWVHQSLISRPQQPPDPRVDARLEALGYLAPGGKTDAEAIKNFQLMNGLPETGMLDQATLDAMWSAEATMSSHIVQFQDATYNPNKARSTGTTGGDNSCGPASVAIALDALGLATIDNADPQALVNDIRADTGTSRGAKTGHESLASAAEKNGAQTYEVTSMDALILAVANGDPVVCFGVPNRGGQYYNSPASYGGIDPGCGHWVTVLGYDAETNTFIVADPLCTDGTLRLTADQMQRYVDFSEPSVAVSRP